MRSRPGQHRSRHPRPALARHLQLGLTDRSDLSAGRKLSVMSQQTWRLADLFAKHAFLLNGLGWGGMRLHTVADGLEAGRLVRLSIEDTLEPNLSMSTVYRTGAPAGAAGRWLVERFKRCAASALSAPERPARATKPDRRRGETLPSCGTVKP